MTHSPTSKELVCKFKRGDVVRWSAPALHGSDRDGWTVDGVKERYGLFPVYHVSKSDDRGHAVQSDLELMPIAQDLYYLQHHGTYSGDSLIWWRAGKHGYTADIKQAHVFTKDEAYAQHRCRSEDRPWRKDFVDANVQFHVSNERVKWKDAK